MGFWQRLARGPDYEQQLAALDEPTPIELRDDELEQAEHNWRTWYAPASEAQKRGEGWNPLGRRNEWIVIRNEIGEVIPLKLQDGPDFPRGVAKIGVVTERPSTVQRNKSLPGYDTLANGNGPERPLPKHLQSGKKLSVKRKLKKVTIPLPSPKQVRSAFTVNWDEWGASVHFNPEKVGFGPITRRWRKHYAEQRLEDSRLFM